MPFEVFLQTPEVQMVHNGFGGMGRGGSRRTAWARAPVSELGARRQRSGVDAEDDGGGRSGDDVVGDRRDETEEEWSSWARALHSASDTESGRREGGRGVFI